MEPKNLGDFFHRYKATGFPKKVKKAIRTLEEDERKLYGRQWVPRSEEEIRCTYRRELALAKYRNHVLNQQRHDLLNIVHDTMKVMPDGFEELQLLKLKKCDSHATRDYQDLRKIHELETEVETLKRSRPETDGVPESPRKRRKLAFRVDRDTTKIELLPSGLPATMADFFADWIQTNKRAEVVTKVAAASKIVNVVLRKDRDFKQMLPMYLMKQYGFTKGRKARRLPRKNSKTDKSRDPYQKYDRMQADKKRLNKKHRDSRKTYLRVNKIQNDLVTFIRLTMKCTRMRVMAFIKVKSYDEIRKFYKTNKKKSVSELNTCLEL